MPYVPPERRAAGRAMVNPGDLNFRLTTLCVEYLATQGRCYQTINDVLGALEGAKLEFYRRVASPYEDTKITQNGDVYP